MKQRYTLENRHQKTWNMTQYCNKILYSIFMIINKQITKNLIDLTWLNRLNIKLATSPRTMSRLKVKDKHNKHTFEMAQVRNICNWCTQVYSQLFLHFNNKQINHSIGQGLFKYSIFFFKKKKSQYRLCFCFWVYEHTLDLNAMSLTYFYRWYFANAGISSIFII